MTKKIVRQERIENQCWVGVYIEWECGCSEIMFSDRGPSFSRKLCGNNHDKVNELERKEKTGITK